MAFLMPNKRDEGVLRQGRKAELKPANELGAFALSWNSTKQVQQIMVSGRCILQQDLIASSRWPETETLLG